MSLSKFVRDINDKKCNFQISADEVKDLEDVVNHVVKEYLPRTLQILPGCWGQYAIAELVNAGSYFEQTKIKQPDEFDFMVVVKQLSEPESIETCMGCRPGYVNVRVTDENKWGRVHSHQSREKSFEIAMLGFNAYLRQALELTKDMPPFQGRYGKLKFKNIVVRGKPYKTFSHVQTAYFKWLKNGEEDQMTYDPIHGRSKVIYKRTDRAEHSSTEQEDLIHGRGTLIYSRTGQAESNPTKQEDPNSFDVDIDLMTCCHVDFDKLEQYVNVRTKAKSILTINGFHLVLKSCNNNTCVEEERDCRLVSYTKSEQQRMRDLHTSWKTVYRVLKWVFGYSSDIDTYKLKSSVLVLSENKATTELADGIIDMVKYLNMCSSKNHMPSYFNESLNVWNVSQHSDRFEKWKLKMLLEILKIMKTIPESEYKYNDFMEVLYLWVVEMHTAPNINPLLDLQRGFSNSAADLFNVQGNTFIDIVRKMSTSLSKRPPYSWLCFRMKAMILWEVFLFYIPRLFSYFWYK